MHTARSLAPCFFLAQHYQNVDKRASPPPPTRFCIATPSKRAMIGPKTPSRAARLCRPTSRPPPAATPSPKRLQDPESRPCTIIVATPSKRAMKAKQPGSSLPLPPTFAASTPSRIPLQTPRKAVSAVFATPAKRPVHNTGRPSSTLRRAEEDMEFMLAKARRRPGETSQMLAFDRAKKDDK
ncbi:uncharacterized protein MYCGRDRAFT_98026 [Zymoseptoria tritici IPO323]|uniref:Uncharacterized protein n=1 Tax=Zymoseptoria tritici (strain CBS 115943 / IPO323) TaxID=336722 RepID=F9XS37_ZYMTI|nr:uncharacterized protein MYCGRDRAFT_98026 [Zymoseptoria tritici IPO323]EGP81946.1 hypothetical protein MYCGRDRAFT_98026 [Zymoseptoria tritici IPO323]